jgi:streptogramin lyase
MAQQTVRGRIAIRLLCVLATFLASCVFTAAAAAAPTVTSISPNNGLTTGGTTVTVTGTGFVSGTTVLFGGEPGYEVSVNSSTSLTVKSPGGSSSGFVYLVVSNTNGTSATGAADQFAYDPPASGAWLGLNANYGEQGEATVGEFKGHQVVYDRGYGLEWLAGEKGTLGTWTGDYLAASLSHGFIPVITVEYAGWIPWNKVSSPLPSGAALETYVNNFVTTVKSVRQMYPTQKILFEPMNEPYGNGTGAQYANIVAPLLSRLQEEGVPLDTVYLAAWGHDLVNGEPWIPEMYAAQSSLKTLARGWYFHPYGPPNGPVVNDNEGIASVPTVQAQMFSGQNNIIVSELGFCSLGTKCTEGPTNSHAESASQAGQWLGEALNNAVPMRKAGWLRALIVYNRTAVGWEMGNTGALTPSGQALETFGDAQGLVRTFEGRPAVTSLAASGVSSSGATLNGSVNPEGSATSYYFEYGTSTSYGKKTSEVSAGSGTSDVAASAGLSGLSPSTTYHYRLVAANGKGTSTGIDRTFTTTGGPKNTVLPVVTPSNPAQAVSEATTNGTWEGSPTSYSYQWRRCNSSGESCEDIAGATKASYVPVLADVGSTLVAKVSATNASGTTPAYSKATSLVRATGTITEYTPPAGSEPVGVTAGPDGNIWFTSWAAHLGKMTVGGAFTEYALPAGSHPLSLTSGAGETLWFTNGFLAKIGKITTAGSITEYSMPAGAYPYRIVTGPDGNMWVTDAQRSKVVKVNPSTGAMTEYSFPASSVPNGIVAGPDGNLWVALKDRNKIAKVTTGGTITEYSLPAGSGPVGITAGPDGNLWFTLINSHKIGKITTAGVITEYSLPVTTGAMYTITTGADGNLWFSMTNDRIGRITTSGVITEFPLETGAHPEAIAAGPESNLWFTEWGRKKIGSITP